MPANTEVVLRIGADVTDLQGKLGAAQGALKNFSSAATTGMVGVAEASQQMAGGFVAASRSVVSSAGGIGKAFESMPRGSAFNLINTQLSSMAYQMTGTSQAGMALASAIGIVERAAISMGTGVLPMVAIMASIAGLMAVVKLATDKSSKALDEYIKKTKEANEENKRFTKDLTDYIEGNQRYNKSVAALHGSFDLMDKAIKFIIPWWQLQNNEIKYITESTDKFRESMKGLMEEIEKKGKKEVLGKFDALIYESQTEQLKRNTEAMLERNKAIDEAIKKQTEENKLLAERRYKADLAVQEAMQTGMKSPFQQPGRMEATGWQKMFADRWKSFNTMMTRMTEAEKTWYNVTEHYARQLSSAFAQMMMGVEVKWDNLIKSMVAELIASGLQAAILSLIPGAGTFGSIFKSLIGFAEGTPYVPQTGLYQLHKGEAVIPASQNITTHEYNYGGGITYNVLAVDWDKLTQEKIVPFIEKMSKDRRTKLITV